MSLVLLSPTQVLASADSGVLQRFRVTIQLSVAFNKLVKLAELIGIHEPPDQSRKRSDVFWAASQSAGNETSSKQCLLSQPKRILRIRDLRVVAENEVQDCVERHGVPESCSDRPLPVLRTDIVGQGFRQVRLHVNRFVKMNCCCKYASKRDITEIMFGFLEHPSTPRSMSFSAATFDFK